MTSTPEENHGPGPDLTPEDDVDGQPQASPGPEHEHPENPVKDPTENPGPEDRDDDSDEDGSTVPASPGPPPSI